MKRVVITGIGIVAPNGIGKEMFWDNLFSGKSFVDEEPLMNELGIKSKVNCKIKEFNLSHFQSFKDEEFFKHLSEQERFIQLGVISGKMAIEDSGIAGFPDDGKSAGVIYSSAIGGTPGIEKIFRKVSKRGKDKVRYQPVGEHFYNAGMVNYPAVLLAHQYGLKNICTSLSTGCTAGLDSIGMSFDLIRNGEAKVMLAGASEAPLTEITYATLDIIGALCVAEGEPASRSRPFDKERAGFVISEGAACLVLEELEHALERNAHIYGEVLSFASVNNAYHMTDLNEDGKSMAKVISKALDKGAVEPGSIDYINAHGSSTAQNDLFETRAYKLALGEHAYNIPISSTKSMIGHSLSSASTVGVIAALGSFKYSKVHPTINLNSADHKCDLDYVPNVAREHKVNRALTTASGFGGIHSVGIFEKYVGEGE